MAVESSAHIDKCRGSICLPAIGSYIHVNTVHVKSKGIAVLNNDLHKKSPAS